MAYQTVGWSIDVDIWNEKSPFKLYIYILKIQGIQDALN